MFGIGWPEMIMIFIVALIAVGPKKLPELARTLGKALGELRKAGQELRDSMDLDDEFKQARRDAADAVHDILHAEADLPGASPVPGGIKTDQPEQESKISAEGNESSGELAVVSPEGDSRSETEKNNGR